MAGRRIETRGERAGRQATRPRTAPHAPARVPGPRTGRKPARSAAGPRGHGPRPALLVSAALLAVGAVLDEAFGSGLGWIFALAAAASAALAAVACTGAQTWWAFALPPLAIAVVAFTARLLLDSSATGADTTTAMATALHWAIDSFPAMAAAELSALAVLTLRTVRSRRYRRAVHA
ncbi:DUF6542 domain-containing protein [Streptomyces sp. NPDC002537]